MITYNNITLDAFRTNWLPDNIQAAMLRLDKLHPEIPGNKWFKLKENLAIAKKNKRQGILTFGGAYSNHIAATAVACAMTNLHAIGVIRGEKPPELNHTLARAAAYSMELHYISREAYREAGLADTWQSRFENYHVVPEGGHNALGASGCEEILSILPTTAFTHILCAAGTGTTLAGLINSAQPHQQVTGIAVLKGAQYLEKEVSDLVHPGNSVYWQLLYDHHEGGYAKRTPGLIDFINTFHAATGIPTDIIYTGKLLMAFRKLAQQGYFPGGSKVLLIHTGGLQGNLSLASGVLTF